MDWVKERELRVAHIAWIRANGCCQVCGSQKDLTFHHVDRNNKTSEVGQMVNNSAEELIIEISKCKLYCQKCHSEYHRREELEEYQDKLEGQ